MTEPKLKPCPFCGGNNIEQDYPDQHGSTIMRCGTCGVEIWERSSSVAMKHWNSRPIEDALEAKIDTMSAYATMLSGMMRR